MNINKIRLLTVEEFEILMGEKTFEYINESYPNMNFALNDYQEGAEGNGESEYLSIDEYFKLSKDQASYREVK